MNTGITKNQSWFERRRAIIEQSARYIIGMGGISVIFAIVLIFFYLLWVVAPIFSSPEVHPLTKFSLAQQDDASSRYIAVEESGHLGVRISSNGEILFFDIADGRQVKVENIELPEYASVSHVVELDNEGRQLAVALDNTRLVFINIKYRVNFSNGQRELHPQVDYPYGEEAVEIRNIDRIADISAIRIDDYLVLAILDSDGELLIQRYEVEEDEELPEPEEESLIEPVIHPDFLLLSSQGQWLYMANQQGQIVYYNIRDAEDPELVDQFMMLKPDDTHLTQLKMLLGGNSLIATDSRGYVSQWSLQRDDKNQYRLKEIRGFQSDSAVTQVIMEKRRKGLLALNEKAELILYNTTAERQSTHSDLIQVRPLKSVISSRGDVMMVEAADGQMYTYAIENHHPEISWKSLWGEVVYEGYNEPNYIWQSSSASNDFEPKFSLMPLAFGTLKAAFYAMLVAVPLAIMGAIYTAYFMSPKMRGWVKPSIEIMEALPTVILGFLAGLWFAPVVEHNLLAIMALILVLPAGLLLFAWLWNYMPAAARYKATDGWHAAILIPVIVALCWFALEMAPMVEHMLFKGDVRHWMQTEFGIGYDQRNALVVGIAMGVAVIPTIFSITEDAIFSVPKHLTNGSLALGATTWQTLTRVVLLTASPGIFSAVMIGLGRAVGETMIVLMATGNTPLMDMSLFQGMRTLSANIAVELPESEVHSSHYRILFLAALVLFVVTFFFNTAAEVVRQRLRKRYGSL
ncbi:MAG: ABC transporter permease subunit [Gammaproteobacteria bacterium]|nr:MAG: ABC transporter permease subunit [Gammaproteobacteria bacterium]